MTRGVRGVSLHLQRFVGPEYTVKRNKRGIKPPRQAEPAVDSLSPYSPSAPLKLGIFNHYGTKNIHQTPHLQYLCCSRREQVFPSMHTGGCMAPRSEGASGGGSWEDHWSGRLTSSQNMVHLFKLGLLFHLFCIFTSRPGVQEVLFTKDRTYLVT